MSDKPILFSSSMVRAILREIDRPGTGKTQTRRVLSSDKPMSLFNGQWSDSYVLDPGNASWRERDLRYAAGDSLYVREAWRVSAEFDDVSPRDLDPKTRVRFEADADMPSRLIDIDAMTGKFRQGMHMPRWASRITLIVTDVRVQRVQEISEADAIAEGVDRQGDDYRDYSDANFIITSARDSFRTLWDSLNDNPKKPGRAWRDNPWVAAYTFRPILGNIDQIGGDA